MVHRSAPGVTRDALGRCGEREGVMVPPGPPVPVLISPLP